MFKAITAVAIVLGTFGVAAATADADGIDGPATTPEVVTVRGCIMPDGNVLPEGTYRVVPAGPIMPGNPTVTGSENFGGSLSCTNVPVPVPTPAPQSVVSIGEYMTGPIDVSSGDRLDVRFDMHRSGDFIVSECNYMGGTVAFRPLPFRFRVNAYFCQGVDF